MNKVLPGISYILNYCAFVRAIKTVKENIYIYMKTKEILQHPTRIWINSGLLFIISILMFEKINGVNY